MKVNKIRPVKQVPARDTVQVHLPDGRVMEGSRGTHIVEFLKTYNSMSRDKNCVFQLLNEKCQMKGIK